MDKMKKEKKLSGEDLKMNRFLVSLIVLAIIVMLFVLILFFCTFGGFPNQKTSEDIIDLIASWGTIGDYFGGLLNPVLGFCSFMALLYTIDLQNKQLKKTDAQLEQNKIALEQNAKALELNNKELKNSNQQLELSSKAQAEMEKTQRLQQFENLFTYMANELSKIYDVWHNVSNSVSASYVLTRSHGSTYSHSDARNFLRSEHKLVRFFMYLYQILKLIDDQPSERIDSNGKKRYSNIIRSSMDNETLQLIFLNCLMFDKLDDDFIKYQILLEKYNFFEHMTFYDKQDKEYNYYFLCLIDNYNISAYGKNYYLRNIPKNILSKAISQRNDYQIKPVSENSNVFIELELNENRISAYEKSSGEYITSFDLSSFTAIKTEYQNFSETIVFTSLEFIYDFDEICFNLIFNKNFNNFSLICTNNTKNITDEFVFDRGKPTII